MGLGDVGWGWVLGLGGWVGGWWVGVGGMARRGGTAARAKPGPVQVGLGGKGELEPGGQSEGLPPALQDGTAAEWGPGRQRGRHTATPPHQLSRAFLRSLGGSAMKVERNLVLCAALQPNGARQRASAWRRHKPQLVTGCSPACQASTIAGL